MLKARAAVLAALTFLPAVAGAQFEPSATFTFPDNGDDALGGFGRVLFSEGDGYRGRRDLNLDECDVITGTFVLSQNQLRQPENCLARLELRISDALAGEIIVRRGEVEIEVGPFELQPAVAGPAFDFELVMAEDVAPQCGSITVALNSSEWECEDLHGGENRRPVCDAGGPYRCDEGGEVALDASGQDPDGDEIIMEWDLDGDGDFDDAEGLDPVIDCSIYDGPTDVEIRARVTDVPEGGGGLSRTCFADLHADNLPPGVSNDLPFNPPVIAAANIAYGFCLNAEDPSPLDDPEYELVRGPDGAEILDERNRNGCVVWVPTIRQVRDAPYQFEVRIFDDDGGEETREWPVTVVADPNTPAAFAGEDQRIEGCSAEICCQGTDPRGQAVTYRWLQLDLDNAPSEVRIEDPTEPCLDIAVPATGDYTFQCTVTNEDELTSPTDRVTVTVANAVPYCDAGFDTACYVGEACNLDGRRSTDPNNDAMTVQWEQISPQDEPVRIVAAGNRITSFTAERPGIYCFRISCRDAEIESEPDEVCFAVSQEAADDPRGGRDRPADHLPVAQCGSQCGDGALDVMLGEPVVLDGSRSYDPDGLPLLEYAWEQVDGPSEVELEEADPPNPARRFVRPAEAGVHVFALRVRDTAPHGLEYARSRWSTPCEFVVQAIDPANAPPVAVAGEGVVGEQGGISTLDGSGSRDPDGDDLNYTWTQLRGPPVDFLDEGTATPGLHACTPGIYRFRLVVDDGQVSSLPSDVWATVHSPCNEAPVGHAGADFIAAENPTQIDARQSWDQDGNTLRFQWLQVDGPPVKLNREFTSRANFNQGQWGIHTFRLFVLDAWQGGGGEEEPPDCWQSAWSLPDDVRVVVNGQNSVPVASAGPDRNQWKVGDLVVVDGCDSRDEDGDELTYDWRISAGPPLDEEDVDGWRTCALEFEATAPGTWVFCLRVRDICGSLEDCVEHTVRPNDNQAPVCRVPATIFSRPGQEVVLDGSGTIDANGDEMTFEWTQLEGPTVEISNADQAIAAFTAPTVEAGEALPELLFELTVSDGRAEPQSCSTRVSLGGGPNCDDDPQPPGCAEGEGEGPPPDCGDMAPAEDCTCEDGASGRALLDTDCTRLPCACSPDSPDKPESTRRDTGCACTLNPSRPSPLRWLRRR